MTSHASRAAEMSETRVSALDGWPAATSSAASSAAASAAKKTALQVSLAPELSSCMLSPNLPACASTT
eukprot:scaffold222107_cov27-Tisochrysis_lutea.AAC.4